MSPINSSPDKPRLLDPVLKHARSEAVIIFIVFAIHMAWSITWCYFNGYNLPSEQPVDTVFGIPSWIFWGVIVPWLVVDLFSVWFCLWYMALDPLGEDSAESESSNDGSYIKNKDVD